MSSSLAAGEGGGGAAGGGRVDDQVQGDGAVGAPRRASGRPVVDGAARCSMLSSRRSSSAPQIEIRIAPRVQLRAAAQRLPAAHGARAFAGVMDQHDREREAALQLAQVGEQRGDLRGGVLIDAMQADEGIEDEQERAEGGDGGLQLVAVVGEIEPEAGRGDDVNRQIAAA